MLFAGWGRSVVPSDHPRPVLAVCTSSVYPRTLILRRHFGSSLLIVPSARARALAPAAVNGTAEQDHSSAQEHRVARGRQRVAEFKHTAGPSQPAPDRSAGPRAAPRELDTAPAHLLPRGGRGELCATTDSAIHSTAPSHVRSASWYHRSAVATAIVRWRTL